MSFPRHRLRRLRGAEAIRNLVQEIRLSPSDLVYPIFVAGDDNVRSPLQAIPGQDMLSGNHLLDEMRAVRDLGIPAVLLFGILADEDKDSHASASYSPEGPVQRAVRQIKAAVPELALIADLCLCEYTDHGHCGLLKNGEIDNDLTLACLRKGALSLAEAGCGVIAPSGVMDGSVFAIRSALDEAGYEDVLTMPYSAKFASRLYGPFKEATRSAPAESKHATHQVGVANARQALSKIRADIEEGADIVIVKPALGFLDVVWRARRQFDVPIAAYSVSGEHNALAAITDGDPEARREMILEALTCIKRAGAGIIITYFAKEAAGWLRGR